MAQQDYIPPKDANFIGWHDRFKDEVAALKTTFGLTDPEVAAVAADNAASHTKLTASNAAKAAAQTANEQKNATFKTVKSNARALAQRLKKHPAYTPALGEQLGIIGPEDSTDLTESKPTLTVDESQPNKLTIGFNKSISDGVNLYSRRGSETAFTFLARDTESPYMDTRPPLTPGALERREYQAVYVLGDDEVGLRSDTVNGVFKS
jgi:hypothetical protein